jgi:hypothetical protein
MKFTSEEEGERKLTGWKTIRGACHFNGGMIPSLKEWLLANNETGLTKDSFGLVKWSRSSV